MTDCCAYIDGSNLFHAGEAEGIRIDFLKFKKIIVGNRTLKNLNYYDSTEKERGETSFHKKLLSFGYNLKLFQLYRYGTEIPEEKMVDTQIVADSLVDAFQKKFDTAIFCTGDKDMLPAIEYLLQMFHKQVEVASFWDSLAWDLKNSGAKIINLTLIKGQIQRI